MATIRELKESRQTEDDRFGQSRGTRVHLLDVPPNSAEGHPLLSNEGLVLGLSHPDDPTMLLDRLSYAPFNGDPNLTRVTSIYSTTGAGRFARKPVEVPVGSTKVHIDYVEVVHTVLYQQQVTKTVTGSNGDSQSALVWDVVELDIRTSGMVLQYEAAFQVNGDTEAIQAASIINALAGDVHLIEGQLYRFEPGNMRPHQTLPGGIEEYRVVYNWIGDPGIPAQATDAPFKWSDLPANITPPSTFPFGGTSYYVPPFSKLVVIPPAAPIDPIAPDPFGIEAITQYYTGNLLGYTSLPGLS